MNLNNARWRKVTDVDREYALFELLINDEILLDIGYSDDQVFEVLFGRLCFGIKIDWDFLRDLIEEGRRLADADK